MLLTPGEQVAIVINCNIESCEVIAPPEGKESMFPNNVDSTWIFIKSKQQPLYASNFYLAKLGNIINQPPPIPKPYQVNEHIKVYDDSNIDIILVSDLRKVFNEKLEKTDSMDQAFTKAVWDAFKRGINIGREEVRASLSKLV